MNIETIAESLTARGYKSHPPTAGDSPSCVGLFQRAVDGVEPVCKTNGRLFLTVLVYEDKHCGQRVDSAVIDITAETPTSQWAKLEVYALSWDELVRDIELLERQLVAAWKAVCGEVA